MTDFSFDRRRSNTESSLDSPLAKKFFNPEKFSRSKGRYSNIHSDF
jgi:hypothetical protein